MNRVLVVCLVMMVTVPATSQERAFGEKNGYDWKNLEGSAETLFSKVDWPNKAEWVNAVAKGYKVYFISGIFEVAAFLPSNYFMELEGMNGKREYYKVGHPFERAFGLTVDQLLKGLDKFYEDYRNMNVTIVDAIYIVKMETTGKDAGEIEWQTRYYRADEATRSKMVEEKFKTKSNK